MKRNVIVHVERDDTDGLSLWAEVPSVPGFYASAPTAREIISRVSGALGDYLTEEGRQLGTLKFRMFSPAPTGPTQPKIVSWGSIEKAFSAGHRVTAYMPAAYVG